MRSSKAIILLFLALFLLITTFSITLATRPDPNNKKSAAPGNGGGYGIPYFGPGGNNGYGIPGFGSGYGSGYGGGYGSGYGGPNGGYGKGGVVRPTVVCKEKGPCLGKKLRCPAKCFTSYGHGGKGYGYGGGGGGCTVDCVKKCTAYC